MGSTLAQSITQLFNFTSYVAIENSALRPNGHLLLTTFDQGRLYTLNPHHQIPQAELVTPLPGATALCGITAIDTDVFAVVGGVRGHYQYSNETLYTVDFSRDLAEPTIRTVTRIPDAVMLNGMASLPEQPHIVLIGDSRLGCIFRADTGTRTSQVVFKHEALAAPANVSIPIGINGLKVVRDHVLFTNSARNSFARIPVSSDGLVFGEVEVVSSLVSSSGSDWDDFAVASDGVVYVAQPDHAIAKFLPHGGHYVVAGGDGGIIHGPRSVQLAKDGKSLYVTTRGDGDAISGQVLEVELPRA